MKEAEKIISRMLAPRSSYRFHRRDCREVLPGIEASSVHLILTAMPCFLENKARRAEDEFSPWFFEEVMRLLVPGGHFLTFSLPSAYHRAAILAEQSGFHIRDQYIWYFISGGKLRVAVSGEETGKGNDSGGRFESILCAQKPLMDSVETRLKSYETGFIDANQVLEGDAPTTVMKVQKTSDAARPEKLYGHLIRLFTLPGQVVLDPFLGTSRTVLAAYESRRYGIGIDRNDQKITQAEQLMVA